MSQTQMREKAVCENTNLLDAQARVQTKLNEPTESRTLKLEPKNLKGRNRGTPEDIVFNKKLTQQTNTQSQQVASARHIFQCQALRQLLRLRRTEEEDNLPQ